MSNQVLLRQQTTCVGVDQFIIILYDCLAGSYNSSLVGGANIEHCSLPYTW